MLAIKKFVDNLSDQPIHLPKSIDYSRSLIYDKINSRNNLKPYVQIENWGIYFINKFFIPLFNKLCF